MEKQIELKKIIKNAKNNDNNAFNVLVNTYGKDVYLSILNKTKDKEKAIEITHLAFLKVFYRISTYNEEFDFKNWVVTIAKNIFIDQQRRKNKNFIIIDDLLVDKSPSQLEVLITEDDKKSLKKAVDHFVLKMLLSHVATVSRILWYLKKHFSKGDFNIIQIGSVQTC